jgi:ATP-binding cassette subfamily F protein 3
LEEALGGYDGTLLLISHDRYFLDKLVGKVIELKEGTLAEYSGNYSYYLWKRDQEKDKLDKQAVETATPQEGKTTSRKTKEQKRLEAETRQEASRKRNKLQNAIEKLERDIEESESQFNKMEEKLADPKTYKDGTNIAELKKEYAQLKKQIKELYEEWESHRLQLEELLETLKQN